MKFSIIISYINITVGSLITISSSSWLMMWLGMELNLLGFIPIMIQKNNPFSNEASMKYFLIQAIASSIFIMASTMLLNPSNNIMMISSPLILTTLSTKIAMAPFHFWLPPLSQTLSWFPLILMLTWQKLAPLSIMIHLNTKIMMMTITISAIIGPMMMLNQTSIKKLLIYSSISHLAWIFSSNMINSSLPLMYFLIYSANTIATSLILSKYNIIYMNQIKTMPQKLKIIILINILSMGGFPPLLGFVPKMIVIISMIKTHNYIPLVILLMISTLISFFSYTRILFTPLLLTPNKTKSFLYMYHPLNILIITPFLFPLFPLFSLFSL